MGYIENLNRLIADLKRYRDLVAASDKASAAREALAAGSSRARVTSANAKWMRAAEERDRLGALITAGVRECGF